MKKLMLFLSSILMVVFLLSTTGSAVPITFIHQGSGSGTLDDTPFDLTEFTIVAYGDTDDIESFGGGYFIDHTSAYIQLGFGFDAPVYEFLISTRTFVNNSLQLAGFSRGGSMGTDLFNGPTNSAFSTWDMLSSIGPISGTGTLLNWDGGVLTNNGTLYFNSSPTDATFNAIYGEGPIGPPPPPDSVPEPSILLLLGASLVGLVGARRKLKK